MKKKKTISIIAVIVVCVIFGIFLITQKKEPENVTDKSFGTVGSSVSYKVPPKFNPLNPGAVKPKGWLEDWAKSAANGITGHLDERAAVYEYGYTAKDFEAVGVKPHGTGWPLEQCAYWLDGLVRLAYILDDEYLINKVTSRLDLVVDGVLNGGESFFYWRPKSDLDDVFNNWAHSHMGRALVAYYQATGEKRILDALVKAYKDYPLPDMLVKSVPCSGVVNLDPLLETYRMSGDENLIKNALAYSQRRSFEFVLDEWGNYFAPDGHGVIFLENVRVPAILYPWTGNETHLNATLRTLEINNKRYGQPYGLIAAEEYMTGAGSTRYTETCNVACGIWTYHWLLRITGQADYADRIEKIFFNAAPVPISRDFQIMSYYQTPNRYGDILPGENPRWGSDNYSELAHGPLCCVGNCNRIIPSYIMHMWMETPDKGLAATLYGPASVKSVVAGNTPVIIETETDYPFESEIKMTVNPDESVRFPLYLRIPDWCENPGITVNGQPIPIEINKNGFVRIERKWAQSDEITLDFPMHTEIVRGRERNYPRVQHDGRSAYYFKRPLSERIDVNEPYAYVNYGPLLFTLPIPDETPNKAIPGTEWNFALDVDPYNSDMEIEVTQHPMPNHWHWQLDGAPIQLQVPAIQFDWNPTGSHPLPKDFIEGGKQSTITLVPYCCTKFHITMFPLTEKTWGIK